MLAVPPPGAEQRCHGACNAGQARNDNPANRYCYDIDVAPQSRTRTRAASRIVENGRLCCAYEGLLCSAIAAFGIEQDRLAPTMLVIRVPAPADYPEFAAGWNIPDIQAENFAAPLRAAAKAAKQITLKPGRTHVPTGGFVEAIR